MSSCWLWSVGLIDCPAWGGMSTGVFNFLELGATLGFSLTNESVSQMSKTSGFSYFLEAFASTEDASFLVIFLISRSSCLENSPSISCLLNLSFLSLFYMLLEGSVLIVNREVTGCFLPFLIVLRFNIASFASLLTLFKSLEFASFFFHFLLFFGIFINCGYLCWNLNINLRVIVYN